MESEMKSAVEEQNKFPWRIRLGSLWGLPFYFHISLLLWIVLIAISKDKFSIMLFVGMLLFSITVHELFHALACRYFGLGGGTLTIWVFGGYFTPFSANSVFDLSKEKRLRYVIMILAGPFSNLLLSAVFFGFAYLFSMEWFYTAAEFNFSIALINLLPIGNLDGGNILVFIGSIFSSWRLFVRITGIFSFLAAGLIFISLFFQNWLSAFDVWVGFLISMGISTLRWSRKSETALREEIEKSVSREIIYAEETQSHRFHVIARFPIIVGLGVLFVFSVVYLGFLYSRCGHFPGKIIYTEYNRSSKSYELFAMNRKSFPNVKFDHSLPHSMFRAAASPNGKQIAFECFIGLEVTKKSGLCISDMEGKVKAEIPFPVDFGVYKIFWINDTGIILSSSVGNIPGIWNVNLESRELKQTLLNARVVDVFSNTQDILIDSDVNNTHHIYLQDKYDGLTNLSVNESNDTPLAFSKDGKYVYFMSERSGNKKIYQMDKNGSSVMPVEWLLDYSFSGFVDLSISPDGKRALYPCGPSNRDEICLVNTDGTGRKTLMEGSDAVWSPDGMYIAVVSDMGKSIYIMNSDGSWPFQLKSWDIGRGGLKLAWIP